MNQAQFDSKFSRIKAKLNDTKNSYDFKTSEEVWSNIGINPLDIAFTELSELYLEADDVQKKQLFDYAMSAKLQYNLWYFIRRVGNQIHSHVDSKWLKIGLAAALIDGARGDFRDLIGSLVLLRFAAEMRGIDTKPDFDDVIQIADDKTKPILVNARDHQESDVHYTVQTFGTPEWKSTSIEKYGEHPSIIRMKNMRAEKKTRGGSFAGLIVAAIIIGLLLLWNLIRTMILK